MANVVVRPGKKREPSCLIRVSDGSDSNGKQIVRTKTWKPKPGMTEKQVGKVLEKAKVMFEKQVKEGLVLDRNITVKDFTANQWMRNYVEKSLAPSSVKRYRSLLEKSIRSSVVLSLRKLGQTI